LQLILCWWPYSWFLMKKVYSVVIWHVFVCLLCVYNSYVLYKCFCTVNKLVSWRCWTHSNCRLQSQCTVLFENCICWTLLAAVEVLWSVFSFYSFMFIQPSFSGATLLLEQGLYKFDALVVAQPSLSGQNDCMHLSQH